MQIGGSSTPQCLSLYDTQAVQQILQQIQGQRIQGAQALQTVFVVSKIHLEANAVALTGSSLVAGKAWLFLPNQRE